MLLPAAATMVATGFATAALGTVPGSDATLAGAVSSTVKVKPPRHVKRGKRIKVRGRITPAQNRKVIVKVNGRKVGKTRSDGDGRFKLGWTPRRPGVYRVTAVAPQSGRAERSRSKAKRMNVYRPAPASYYGPGLYGNGTACGGRLTPSKLGVAHKRLPCGSRVTLRYRGNTVTVPVIDRGPFAGNREYDLTAATKRKLGFGSTGTVLATK